MKRDSYIQKLEAWKNSARRKPLILEGARQVGKTWLMREFAASHYGNVVYVRFDKDRQLRRIFARDFDVGRILHELEIAFRTRIEPSSTVLLFDEIQACKDALTSLKYFCEDRPDLHVIAAGSLLGLEYRDGDDENADQEVNDSAETTGFPVGKVNTLPVHPLSFREFVCAMGDESLAAEMEHENYGALDDFAETLSDRLRHYFVIGGMPEAVEAYRQSGNLLDVHAVHREILSGYRRDFAKHAPKAMVSRIAAVWDSIPAQLAKENRKFSYSLIKKGDRASRYRDPIAWLVDAGLVHVCTRSKAPRIPLSSYADTAFKVYLLDLGLLSSMSGLDSRIVIEGSRVFSEFKGALAEQYVCQQLVSEYDAEPYYWSTEDSRTEIDFLIQKNMGVVPVEVKSGENLQSKSLKSYIGRYRPEEAIRFSLRSYSTQAVPLPDGAQCRLSNIPLYAVK